MVSVAAADAVERAVAAGSGGTVDIETDDGRITLVVPRIVYLKRYTRGRAAWLHGRELERAA